MKPVQISGPWNDDVAAAQPSWEGVSVLGGMRALG